MNASLRRVGLSGKVLDLGAGNVRSSYFDFFRKEGDYQITSIDISHERKPDIRADLEQPLPVSSEAFDSVLCFNLLEHIYNYQQLVNESFRVLRPGGRLIGYVPFLVKFHPDPNDYFRYTAQGLEKIFRQAAFQRCDIRFIGRGPLTAAWAQMEYIAPRIVRWPITLLVFALDGLLLRFKPVLKEKYPLGLAFTVQR